VPEKLAEFKTLEAERVKEESLRQAEEAKQQAEVPAVSQDKFDQFSKLWNNEDNLDEDKCKI
jgi:hypothetical protein